MASVTAMGRPTPTRPPRKPQKETSGLLMSVIRTLSASESTDDRDNEKAKLEKEYKRSDQRLEELVAENHEALTQTMQTFSKACVRLSVSRQKISAIKENLFACKKLLDCKREELKKLYLKGIEHKQVLHLLEQIENLTDVPDKVESRISKKHYLHATELLVNSIALLNGSLDGVGALSDVKNELQTKKTHLNEVAIDELHKHLYIRSTTDVFKIQRQGSGVSRDSSPFHRHGSDRSKPTKREAGAGGGTPVKRNLLDVVAPTTPTHKHRQQLQSRVLASGSSTTTVIATDTPEQIFEDLLATDPEEDSMHFMGILVECLSLLNCIPEAVDTIKVRMQRELLAIVRRAATQIGENAQAYHGENLATQTQPRILLELLELLFEQFRCVAVAHECVLSNLRRIVNSQQLEVSLYDMADVWSKIQAMLQLLLTDYLDIQNASSAQPHIPVNLGIAEIKEGITSFFNRKRANRSKRPPLFKFDASSNAISMNSYLQEQKQKLYAENPEGGGKLALEREKFFICRPHANNITVIFRPLMRFIREIEQALNYSEGNHCTLHVFVTDYVKDIFLTQVHDNIATSIGAVTNSLDAWKTTVDPEVQKTLNVPRPLLQSTISIEKNLQELWDLMHQLPLYSDHFLNLICSILVSYKEACQAAYKSIVQPEGADNKRISATWAKDEDISRYLKSLPNWTNLQHARENRSPDYEESPEEIRLRNIRETEMLTGNLGETLIPHHEILSDVEQLRTLALLQESLEWFGSRISRFACSLPGSITSPLTLAMVSPPNSPVLDISPVADNTILSLQQVAREFEELADTCLLVLHLEVRVHCFYYLLPIAKQGSFASPTDFQDPDPQIVKLNRDLLVIEENLSSTFQPRKFKYVFEGLGHLVGSILINSAQYIKRINANGIKKMCRNIFSVQQNLTNITMSREVALDRARQYYEMMYLIIEDILNTIVDQGPQFTELEYMNALNILHRSLSISDPIVINKDLDRLKEILSEKPT